MVLKKYESNAREGVIIVSVGIRRLYRYDGKALRRIAFCRHKDKKLHEKDPRHEKVWPVKEMAHWSKVCLWLYGNITGQGVRRLGLKCWCEPNELSFGDLQCMSICVFVLLYWF